MIFRRGGEGKSEKPTYNDLETLSYQQKATITHMRGTINTYNKTRQDELERIINDEAEGANKELSYVIVDGNGLVIASTPTFREHFHYSEIHRVRYTGVLKTPEVDGHAKNWINLTAFLQDQGEDGLEATMLDGKNKPRNVYVEKKKPLGIQCTEYNEFGKFATHTLVYRRIDVDDIGEWKKHHKSRRKSKTKTLAESKAVLNLEQVEIEDKDFAKAMKYYSSHLLQKGITANQVAEIWDKLKRKNRNYGNWKKDCLKLVLNKRRGDRKKREKKNKH